MWYKDGVRQPEAGADTKVSNQEEDADDRYVNQVMADAKKARDKRDRAAFSHS